MCKSLSLAEVRALKPIPSAFTTSRVMRLRRWSEAGETMWGLSEVTLPTPFYKTYDDGTVEEWLSLYEEAARPEDMRFIAALAPEPVGLLTWTPVAWNNTIWLVDIRVRQAYSRKGAGSALMNSLKDNAKGLRARGISVETQINNVPALQFYRHHGFAISGFNDTLYTNEDFSRQDVAVYLFWPRTPEGVH